MFDYFKKISEEYNVSFYSVLSISLNRYGIVSDVIKDSRVRFNLNFIDSDVSNFFAIGVNTFLNSPFKLIGNNLYLDDVVIGTINNVEEDTCTSTYFRNNKQDITLNSNSRSKCCGCKFCGTYSLSEDDDVDFTSERSIINYFDDLLMNNNIDNMSKINSITVCTGCFEDEKALVDHLLLLNQSISKMGFDGKINYIGSQLRNYNNIDLIKDNINNFGLYLTIEKFLERDKFMKPEKASLTLDCAKELLNYCKDLNIDSTFLYILGLENLEIFKKYLLFFRDSINKFPIIQVFQNYTIDQEKYRCCESLDMRYFLDAKRIVEDVFKDTTLVPKLWECYRSLYYSDKDVKVRCLTK